MEYGSRTRPAWMDPNQPDIQEIHRGDEVLIHFGRFDYPCTVLSADGFRWGNEVKGWYLEVEHANNGGYGYWKQGSDGRSIDGGWVEVVKCPHGEAR